MQFSEAGAAVLDPESEMNNDDAEEMIRLLPPEFQDKFRSLKPELDAFQKIKPDQQRKEIVHWIKELDTRKKKSKTDLDQTLDFNKILKMSRDTHELLQGLKEYNNDAVEILYGFLEWRQRPKEMKEMQAGRPN